LDSGFTNQVDHHQDFNTIPIFGSRAKVLEPKKSLPSKRKIAPDGSLAIFLGFWKFYSRKDFTSRKLKI
jgi:hypothetical protein